MIYLIINVISLFVVKYEKLEKLAIALSSFLHDLQFVHICE